MNEKNKKIIFYTAVFLIMLAGVWLRMLFFSYARPFWNDESALALNVLNRDFFGLFRALDYNQAAPPLFVILGKMFLSVFKNLELSLRLPSLLFSILSIPVFYLLSKRLLKSRIAVIFALMLFSLNYQLIYYAQEFKHYSCDVFCFLTILLLCFLLDFKKLKTPYLLCVGVWLAITPWMSYTALIAEAVLFFSLFSKDKKKTLVLFSLPFLSFASFLPVVQRMNSSGFLHSFWAYGFIEKDFSNISMLVKNNTAFYFPDFPNKFLILIMICAGLWGYAKDFKKQEAFVIFSIFSVAFILAYLKIYPVYLRTCLYLFPIVLILIAKPFDMFVFKQKYLTLFFAGFLFAHFGLCTLKTDFTQILQKEYYCENTLLMLEKFVSVSKPGDVLVVTEAGRINFELYSKNTDLSGRNVILMNKNLYELSQIQSVYALLPANRTYYVLLTHSGDKINEYKNLCAYAETMKNSAVISDKSRNALIRFSNK